MNKAISRTIYRILVGLHPVDFQEEFGDEMLWIFEEESEHGTARLFLDGASSLLRQRCRVQRDVGQLSITSGAVITGPGMSPIRLLQAAITFSIVLFSLIQLTRPNPLTVSVRWSNQMSCYTLTLQAPSHAEVVLENMP